VKPKLFAKMAARTRNSKRLLATTVLCFTAAIAHAADSFTWVTKAINPLQRFEAMGGTANGKLYQFSGYYTVGKSILATPLCHSYDPATDKWSRLADIPHAISHCGQVADTDQASNSIFWLAGGFLGDHPGPSTTEVWKYNINNNTWSPGPPLPAPRAGGALVKLGRVLHYFGGTIRTNGVYQQDYGTHWTLNLDNPTAWQTTTSGFQLLAPLPNPRNHMGGTALNGKIYAIGGQHLGNQDTTAQNEVDVYDPATNRWMQAAPMPRPIGHVTANVFVRNGRVVVTSGAGNNSTKLPNVIEYDPATNTWAELPPLPDGRQSPVSGLLSRASLTVDVLPLSKLKNGDHR
jgi:N-acetylneuraminic acid mutarotase